MLKDLGIARGTINPYLNELGGGAVRIDNDDTVHVDREAWKYILAGESDAYIHPVKPQTKEELFLTQGGLSDRRSRVPWQPGALKKLSDF